MRSFVLAACLVPCAASAATPAVSFAPNAGHADAEVRFVARSGGSTALITSDGAALPVGDHVVRLRFDHGEADAWSRGDAVATATYVHGTRAAIAVPTYDDVQANDVWAGIDVAWHGRRGMLEYDFVVDPGTDPHEAGVRFEGADAIAVDAAGDLVVTSGSAALRQLRPVAWQADGREVAVRWVLDPSGRASFELGPRDRTQTLTIDPVLVWEVQWTGPNTLEFGNEESLDIAMDKKGNSYVTGYTTSSDFPITGGAPIGGLYDAFVVKLDPDGNIVWSTFLGGSEDEQGRGIGVDGTGSVVVMGRTNSTDFPTVNALQPTLAGGSDAFVARLSPNGQSLVYSTYLGGSSWEIGDDGVVLARLFNGDVDADDQGNAYVTGDTMSLDFPVSANAIQPANAGGPCIPACEDAFAVKLDPTGQLAWGTYLGGKLIDRGWGISVDRATGEAVLTGEASSDFPTTPGAFQEVSANGFDNFVTKIASDGSLVWSTFLGGTITEEPGNELAIHRDGSIFVTGRSSSLDYPTTPGVFQPEKFPFGDFEAVLTHLDSNGGMIWSTYIGGGDDEVGYGIDVDKKGRPMITGQTTSGGTYPEVAAFEGCSAAELLTLTELNASGSKVKFSTCLPSSGFRGNALAILGDTQVAAGSSHAGPGAVEATVLRVDDFLPGVADLAVSQIDSPDPVPNELVDLTYEISIDNLGPDPALDVRLNDTIPDAVTFRTVTSTHGVCSGGSSSVSCDLGTIDAGDVATVKIVVSPSCTTPQPMSNSVEVSSGSRDPSRANDVSEETSLLDQGGC